ncbi:MAG: YbhN family protein [Polyangiaceae bacterium]
MFLHELRLRRSLGLLVIGVSMTLLVRLCMRIDFLKLREYVSQIPAWRMVCAVVLSFTNFAQLTAYDRIGLSYLRRELPWVRVTVASFIATVIAHNIGPSLATGGSVRLRFYSEWGVELSEIATLVTVGMLTFWVGFAAVAGPMLLTIDVESAERLYLPPDVLRWAGAALSTIVLGYLLFCWFGPRRIHIRRWQVRVPSIKLAAVQCIVAASDWLAMTLILSLLLPPGVLPFPRSPSGFRGGSVGGDGKSIARWFGLVRILDDGHARPNIAGIDRDCCITDLSSRLSRPTAHAGDLHSGVCGKVALEALERCAASAGAFVEYSDRIVRM